jgi:hypothetical protein
MDNDLYKHNDEVAPDYIVDEHIKRVIVAACKLNGMSPALVNPHIPQRNGLRNTFVFMCLLSIYASPRLTKTAYAKAYNNCQQATCHAIDYLKELGLARVVPKRRLIKPLQRYKIDVGYEMTSKGFKVITDILTKAEIT